MTPASCEIPRAWQIGDILCRDIFRAHVIRTYPRYTLWLEAGSSVIGTQAELEAQGWRLLKLTQLGLLQ